MRRQRIANIQGEPVLELPWEDASPLVHNLFRLRLAAYGDVQDVVATLEVLGVTVADFDREGAASAKWADAADQKTKELAAETARRRHRKPALSTPASS